MAVTDLQVLTTTQAALMPRIVDSITTENVLLFRLFTNQKNKEFPGREIEQPVKVTQSSQGGVFSGYDLLDTDGENNRQLAIYTASQYYQPVTLSGLQISQNKTKEQKIDLVTAQMEEAKTDMCDGLASQLYTGDGTGINFFGLATAISDSGTYAGLDRATYSSWQANVTAVGGNLTLDLMAAKYDDCKRGMDKPTMIVTTEAIFSFYEKLMTPTVQSNYDALKRGTIKVGGFSKDESYLAGHQGFATLDYRGTPVVSDEQCTSGTMFFINEKYLYWAGLPDALPGSTPITVGAPQTVETAGLPETAISAGFSWTGFVKPTNQHSVVGHIILQGQWICTNPNRQGKLTGITGV